MSDEPNTGNTPPPNAPLPNTPPVNTPPATQPVVIIPPKDGCGCFAKGCLIFLIACFALTLLVCAGSWIFYGRLVERYTSNAPVDVRVGAPSDAEIQMAEAKLSRLREGVANNQETTVHFTTGDLNALIARDPDFSEMRGHARVGLVDSDMIIEISVPLTESKLPGLRGHWLNGTARFSFGYANGGFSFDPKSAEAGGRSLPGVFLSHSFSSSFSDHFSKSFHESMTKKEKEAGIEFWDHIRSITLRDGEMIVTTGPSVETPLL